MFNNLREVKMELLTQNEVSSLLSNNTGMSFIKHPNNPLLLGKSALLKVNTNIGVSNKDNLNIELEKLECLSKVLYSPDSLMDHTIIRLEKPLWKYMLEIFDKPIGTLPHYTAYQNDCIDKVRLLETIEEMAEYGISFMTLHPTAALQLLETAKSCRCIPTTSRGGVLVLKDAQVNKRNVNIFVDNIDEIIKIFKKYNITMSIGTTFRPATIDEALDSVQLQEIDEQKKYIDYVKSKGVNVMMEGVGHLSLDNVRKYCELIDDFNVPLMPLGPMTTDATIGFDHVTSAIGATIISMFGNVGMINSVTREEHTGGVPTKDSIIEGLKSARVAAHSINLMRHKVLKNIDRTISEKRAFSKSCAISGGIFDDHLISENEGCSRCSFECPLTLLK